MATIGPSLEIHYKLIGMPNEVPPAGSTIHVDVAYVEALEDNAIEVTLKYLDHD